MTGHRFLNELPAPARVDHGRPIPVIARLVLDGRREQWWPALVSAWSGTSVLATVQLTPPDPTGVRMVWLPVSDIVRFIARETEKPPMR